MTKIDATAPTSLRLVGMTQTSFENSDPKALLAVLRPHLKPSAAPTATMLLKGAQLAIEAFAWPEAAGYSRRLVLKTGSLKGVKLLARAAYELGLEEDLDTLWRQLAPVLGSEHAHASASDSTETDGKSPRSQIDQCGMTLAHHLIKKGNLHEGLALRLRLRHVKQAIRHPVARDTAIPWAPRPPATESLLVISEQAAGDQVLWAASFEELSRQCPKSLVECTPLLVPVFRRSFPALHFVAQDTDELSASGTPTCRKALASELDHILGTRLEKPCPRQWLLPDKTKSLAFRKKYQQRCPGKKLVGLSWKSYRPGYSEYKSIPLSSLTELLLLPEYGFVSLQYGEVELDIRQHLAENASALLVDPDVDALQDLDTWAAQVAAMDVVVTTSNTTAHMAAALGVPTILVLPSRVSVLYYWGYEGKTTPWYPSIVEIVRGDGDIHDVVSRARAALDNFMFQKGA